MKEPKMTNEERWFGYYLEELKQAGYIKGYWYQPPSFVLCEESKHPFKNFREKLYTPDYCVMWCDKATGVFVSDTDNKVPFYLSYPAYSYIDVKGSGFKFGLNNSDITFPDRQAWLWSTQGIFIQKVEVSLKPKSIFEKTFLPQRIKEEEVYTTTGKTWNKGESKIKFNALTLEEYACRQKTLHEAKRSKGK